MLLTHVALGLIVGTCERTSAGGRDIRGRGRGMRRSPSCCAASFGHARSAFPAALHVVCTARRFGCVAGCAVLQIRSAEQRKSRERGRYRTWCVTRGRSWCQRRRCTRQSRRGCSWRRALHAALACTTLAIMVLVAAAACFAPVALRAATIHVGFLRVLDAVGTCAHCRTSSGRVGRHRRWHYCWHSSRLCSRKFRWRQ